MGISALCNSGKRNTRYRETIHKATDLLVELRNTDGSWSVTADTSEEQKNGVVSNSVFAIQSLIQAGYFNLNETEPNQLEKNLDYIFHSIKWLYTQRIEKHGADVHYGWGYSGETENKIYIMPTVSVLVTLKMVYYELARIWKQKLDKPIADNKTLLEIIDEVQDSLYSFRISPNEGWGKEINESEDRIVYTLYGLYGLSYAEEEEEGTNYPADKLNDADVNHFAKMMCSWNKKKCFDKHYLDSLNPKEYFDTFIQQGTGASLEIIDHETFFEAIAVISIIGFVKRYKKKINVSSHSQLY